MKRAAIILLAIFTFTTGVAIADDGGGTGPPPHKLVKPIKPPLAL